MGYRHYQDMLAEQGVEKAQWMRELDMESNSGAHLVSESFVKTNGGYGKIEDKSVPGNRDISVDWGSVDSKLGTEVSFDSKADV